jgi:hypothetical protein
MSYKGYVYCPETEYDGDISKIYHTVYKLGAPYILKDENHVIVADYSLPLSPYDRPTLDFFKKWIDAGKPYPINQRVSMDELDEMILHKSFEQIVLRGDKPE